MSRSVNLQRRHFEYIADILLQMKGLSGITDEQHADIVHHVACHLRHTNHNFMMERFKDRSRGVVKVKPKSRAALKEEEATNYWE